MQFRQSSTTNVGGVARTRFGSLYTGVILISIATAAGRTGTNDSLAMLNVAQSIVNRGSLESSPCEPQTNGNHCVPGRGGRLYSGFGILPSAVVAPAVAIADRLVQAFDGRGEGVLRGVAANLTTILIGALVPVLLTAWLWRMGFSWSASAWSGVLLYFGTVHWHHTVKGFYSEPYFSAALLGSAYLLLVARRDAGAFLSGAAFGCAVASRVFGVVFAPAFISYAYWLSSSEASSGRYRRAFFFCLGATPFGAAIALANYERFGSVFKTGYHLAYPSTSVLLSNSAATGIKDLLFDGEVGLVWFTPWIVLLPWLMFKLWKRRPVEAAFSVGIVATSLIFFAKYVAWHGGWAYGPRLLAPSLPFAAVSLAAGFDMPQTAPGRRALLVLALASVAIQAIGMQYPMSRYYHLQQWQSARQQPPFWGRSLIRAQIVETSVLWAAIGPRDSARLAPKEATEARAAADSAEDSPSSYFESFPSPINLTLPDLWIVKMGSLGVPWAIPIGVAFALMGSGLAFLYAALRTSVSWIDEAPPAQEELA